MLTTVMPMPPGPMQPAGGAARPDRIGSPPAGSRGKAPGSFASTLEAARHDQRGPASETARTRSPEDAEAPIPEEEASEAAVSPESDHTVKTPSRIDVAEVVKEARPEPAAGESATLPPAPATGDETVAAPEEGAADAALDFTPAAGAKFSGPSAREGNCLTGMVSPDPKSAGDQTSETGPARDGTPSGPSASADHPASGDGTSKETASILGGFRPMEGAGPVQERPGGETPPVAKHSDGARRHGVDKISGHAESAAAAPGNENRTGSLVQPGGGRMAIQESSVQEPGRHPAAAPEPVAERWNDTIATPATDASNSAESRPSPIDIGMGPGSTPSAGKAGGAGPVTAAAASHTATGGMSGPENFHQLVERALFSVREGHSEARIALKPEHLGHVRLQIVTENQVVSIRIVTESSATRELIDANTHQLKADLQQQGLNVDTIEVSIGDRENDSYRGARQRESYLRHMAATGDGRTEEGREWAPPPNSTLRNGPGRVSGIDYFA